MNEAELTARILALNEAYMELVEQNIQLRMQNAALKKVLNEKPKEIEV